MSRYIVFEVLNCHSPGQIVEKELNSVVISAIGELNLALSGYRLIRERYDEQTCTGIIKCDVQRLQAVRAALALVKTIGGEPVVVNVRGVSGTIKTAVEKFTSK